MELNLKLLEELTTTTTAKESNKPIKNLTNVDIQKLEKERREKQASILILREYCENIKISEMLRAEISITLQKQGRGANLEDLLLKAIKIISLLAKDELFYKQNLKILKGE